MLPGITLGQKNVAIFLSNPWYTAANAKIRKIYYNRISEY